MASISDAKGEMQRCIRAATSRAAPVGSTTSRPPSKTSSVPVRRGPGKLVGARLDGPGMRWSRDRSEAILHVRCVLINGMWDGFAAYLAQLPQFRLSAQPVPTRTHDAIVKQAA